MKRLIVISLMLACVCVAHGQTHRGPTDTAMLRLMASTSTAPTDYQHYWHPSLFADSDDHAGSLDGTTYGTLTESSDGWSMGTDNSKYVILSGPISNSTSYTISFWFSPDLDAIAQNTYFGIVITDVNSADSTRDFDILISKTSNMIFRVVNTAGAKSSVSLPVLSEIYQHALAKVDFANASLSLNIDGATATNVMVGTPRNINAWNACIGSYVLPYSGDGSSKYHGMLDAFKFYNRAISDEEVTALRNLGR